MSFPVALMCKLFPSSVLQVLILVIVVLHFGTPSQLTTASTTRRTSRNSTYFPPRSRAILPNPPSHSTPLVCLSSFLSRGRGGSRRPIEDLQTMSSHPGVFRSSPALSRRLSMPSVDSSDVPSLGAGLFPSITSSNSRHSLMKVKTGPPQCYRHLQPQLQHSSQVLTSSHHNANGQSGGTSRIKIGGNDHVDSQTEALGGDSPHRDFPSSVSSSPYTYNRSSPLGSVSSAYESGSSSGRGSPSHHPTNLLHSTSAKSFRITVPFRPSYSQTSHSPGLGPAQSIATCRGTLYDPNYLMNRLHSGQIVAPPPLLNNKHMLLPSLPPPPPPRAQCSPSCSQPDSLCLYDGMQPPTNNNFVVGGADSHGAYRSYSSSREKQPDPTLSGLCLQTSLTTGAAVCVAAAMRSIFGTPQHTNASTAATPGCGRRECCSAPASLPLSSKKKGAPPPPQYEGIFMPFRFNEAPRSPELAPTLPKPARKITEKRTLLFGERTSETGISTRATSNSTVNNSVLRSESNGSNMSSVDVESCFSSHDEVGGNKSSPLVTSVSLLEESDWIENDYDLPADCLLCKVGVVGNSGRPSMRNDRRRMSPNVTPGIIRHLGESAYVRNGLCMCTDYFLLPGTCNVPSSLLSTEFETQVVEWEARHGACDASQWDQNEEAAEDWTNQLTEKDVITTQRPSSFGGSIRGELRLIVESSPHILPRLAVYEGNKNPHTRELEKSLKEYSDEEQNWKDSHMISRRRMVSQSDLFIFAVHIPLVSP